MSKKTKKVKSTAGNFLSLLRYVGKYKKYAFLTIGTVLLESLFDVLIPLIMGKLINEGISGYKNAAEVFIEPQFKYCLIYGGVMVALAIVSTLLGTLGAKFAVKASQGFAKNLREVQFEAIQKYSFSNTDKFQTSSLITRMTTDVTTTAQSFQMTIRMMTRAPSILIFGIIMSLSINKDLALIFIAVSPILLILLIIIMGCAFPSFRKMLHKFDDMNRDVQENLIGIRVVKSFVREDHETEKFYQQSQDVRKLQLHAERIIIWNGPIMNFCVYTSMILICFIGGSQIINGTSSMNVGQLQSFISYTTQILMSLMMISMFVVQFVMAAASMQRINEVVSEVPSINDEGNEDLPVKDGSIVFKDVNFSYQNDASTFVLSDINISIKSGETIGIIGGTGSSKSTIVNLIPRLYDVTTGELLVGGVNVKNYKLKTLRDNVAVVLQKNVLFSGTIAENLRCGKEDATQEEIEAACKKACAHDFILNFKDGYQTDLGQGGVNVSGGQKQRLCIARALLKNPKILILDDSTSAVDTATDASIRKEFKKGIPDVTKLIIAQRVASVKDADRIIVLNNGRIDAFDTHENLLKSNAIYQEVYSSQMKGVE